jgi:hypothetical protein
MQDGSDTAAAGVISAAASASLFTDIAMLTSA